MPPSVTWPALSQPFAWRDGHVAADLQDGHVLFTTRHGGVSTGPYASLNLGTNTDDDADRTAENRRRLAEEMVRVGLAFGRQVHEAYVHTATQPGRSGDADGQATTAHDVACTVLTADCLPVALVAPGAVAMVHAGWRGLAAGVLEEGVRAVRSERATALIGPGAHRCCYEVGDEVRAAFADEDADVHDGTHLDLPLIAQRRLRRAGVDMVHTTGLCTMCGPELFFSHRRDGGVTGRQGGVAWRRRP